MKKILPFMEYKWPFLGLSTLLLALSLFAIFAKGINFGVDFKGGVKVVYKFSSPITDGQIRTALESSPFADAEVIRFGLPKENSFMIKLKSEGEATPTAEITSLLQSKTGGVELLSEESVGPKVGAELRRKGIFAIILTWVLMLVYVGIRFDFLFAPGAIVALIHDVLISLGVFVFMGKEFNLPILAALLTIIGYSINDTIVIYDRIRENFKKFPSSMPLVEVLNRSLTETLSRTIVTSLTVLFAVLILFIFGGGVINDFAFVMTCGVVVGSYSTLFIATPCYLWLTKVFPGKGMVRTSKAKR